MLVIYLKPTNFCNVDCSHCYLPKETRSNRLKMSDDTLIQVASMAKRMMQAERHPGVHFIWHGGEPLVLSPEYFRDAYAVLQQAMGDTPFTSSLQSSLIPYSERWAEVIHDLFESQVGSSIDFSQRTIRNDSQAYLDLWVSKVALARSHGIKVTPSMVPTTAQVDRAKEIMEWFEEHRFSDFNIERFSRYGGVTIDWPSNVAHSGFLIGLFDQVWERISQGKTAPMINVMVAGIRGVLLDLPGERWGTQCQRSFVVVEPDGSLNSCPDRTQHETPFSNASDGADAFMASPARREWIRIAAVTHQKPHCSECEFNRFCRSGCPVTPNGPPDGEQECSGYKRFLLHVQDVARRSDENESILLRYCQGEFRPRGDNE